MKKHTMTYVLALVLCFAVIVPLQAKAAAMAPVEGIVQPALDKIIKKGMTTDQKVKACYFYIYFLVVFVFAGCGGGEDGSLLSRSKKTCWRTVCGGGHEEVEVRYEKFDQGWQFMGGWLVD